MDGLRQMVFSGQINKDTLVWKAGMASWEKAGDVQELSFIFNMTPPPIPNGGMPPIPDSQ